MSTNYYGVERIDSFFEHHGVQGQKWGRRRWQNPDGTLTPEGRERYNKYAKQLGYGDPRFNSRTLNKVASGAGSYMQTRLAARSARDLYYSGKFLKTASEASKANPNFAVPERQLGFLNFMSALNVANIGATAVSKIAIYRRRRFLIKYADAYGGKKAAEIKKLAQEARNASAIGTGSAIGASVYDAFARKKAAGM